MIFFLTRQQTNEKTKMSDTKVLEAANAAYEHMKAAGKPVTVTTVEKEFGIEKGKLGNWRSNQKRLKSVIAAAPGLPSQVIGSPVGWVGALNGEVQEWELDDISMHGNIRTEFEVEDLQSLANSLRSTTLLQFPIGYVGEKNGKPHLFLFVGERRFRAHELRRDRGEDVHTMKVRVMPKPTERQFLQMNFVENIQRVDLKPSDTARGIRQMLDLRDEETGQPVFTMRSCAEELGMRLKGVLDLDNVLNAPAKAIRALDEGRASLALVGQIGGLPKAMQDQATEEMIFGAGGAMAEKEARAHIANRYRRDFRQADFDKEDATLTEAGACTACPWYGANRDDLEGSGRKTAHLCLNPKCFLEKQAAAAERERERIAEEGGNVVLLSEEECAKVFDSITGRIEPKCGFVSLDAKPEPYYLEGGERARAAAPKWRDAVGAECPVVHVAWDPAGKRVELIETGPAMVAALNGAFAVQFNAKAAEGLLTAEEEALQRAIKSAMDREGRAVCVEGARDLYGKLHNGPGFDRAMVRNLVRVAAEQGLKPDDYHFLGEMLEPGLAKAKATHRGFLELVEVKCASVAELLALQAILLQVRSLRYNGFEPWCEEDNPMAEICTAVDFSPEAWWKLRRQRIKAAEKLVRKEAGKQGEDPESEVEA